MTRRHLSITALTALALVAVFRPDAAPEADADLAQSHAAQATAAAAADRWIPGLALTYAVDSEVWIYTEGQDPLTPTVQIDGELTMTIAAIQGDTVLAVMSMSDVAVEPAEMVPGVDALSRPSALAFGLDGTLREVACAAEMTVATCRMVRSLAATAQLTLSPGDAWQVRESDTTGTYDADYRWVGDEIEREKIRYAQLATVSGLIPAAEDAGTEASGVAQFSLHDSGHPAHIEATQHVVVTGEGMATVYADELCDLSLIDVARVAIPGPPDTEAFGPVARPFDTGEDIARLDHNLVGDMTPDALMAALAALQGEQGDDATRARISLSFRAAAMMRLNPELAAFFGEQILALGDTPAAHALISALSSAACAEAAAVLQDLYDHPDFALSAFAASALSEYTDAATIDALSAIAGGDTVEGRSAARALGAAARTGDMEVDLLLDMAASADVDTARAGLDALGNAGDVRGLDTIIAALDDPALASNAAYALRHMPGEAIDALLVDLLMDSFDVASAAIQALEYRDASVWGADAAALLSEDSLEESVAMLLQHALEA